jgi:A/G-specific adenine glycosylase
VYQKKRDPEPLRLNLAAEKFAAQLLGWYREVGRNLPWRNDSNPYRVWISEIMLQQTQVKAVLPYFERFLAAFPTVEDLAGADLDEVLTLWAGLGYYSRARNLHHAAQIVVREYKGVFPQEYEAAIQLPGIGRYTAGAILSLSYGAPLPVQDGNVYRVLARYLAIEEGTRAAQQRRIWKLLEDVVCDPFVSRSVGEFNQAVMELGATVCRPGKPDCESCPVASSCLGLQSGLQEVLPAKQQRATREFHYVVFVVERNGSFLFRKNLEGPFLKGMWELPRIAGKPDPKQVGAVTHIHGIGVRIAGIHPPVAHQITFRKLSLHPVIGTVSGEIPASSKWAWSPLKNPRIPLSAYVGKVAKAILADWK